MSRLLLAVWLLAVLLLVGVFVPVNGKTVVERYGAAPSAGQFAGRGWSGLVASWDRLWGVTPAPKPVPRVAAKGTESARGAPPSAAPAARPIPEPVEHHTAEDRSALDRIVAERAHDKEPPRR